MLALCISAAITCYKGTKLDEIDGDDLPKGIDVMPSFQKMDYLFFFLIFNLYSGFTSICNPLGMTDLKRLYVHR